MARTAILFVILALAFASSGCAERSQAETTATEPVEEQRFDRLVATYPDMTYQQLIEASPKREYLKELSFDPASAKFYGETVKQLQLTEAEQAMLRRQGFVAVDHDQRYSFGSLYYAIYTRDLPVLVTTDSILHAMHETYDNLLMELEQQLFTPMLDEILSKCHEQLASEAPSWGGSRTNYEDVDLYLTVALNLLRGAGAPTGGETRQGVDAWNGDLLVATKLEQDKAALDILFLVRSLTLQLPTNGEFTAVYGGRRAIDYSQFQPRGHYTKSAELSRYFRAMMWLGRADTGWNILPPDRQSGIVSDSERELRNAVLLTTLMQSTGTLERLRQISDILDFLVGESDNLTVFQLSELFRKQNVTGIKDVGSGRSIEALQDALRKSELGAQQIRSQVVLSDSRELYQVPPPNVFQLFGQRFTVDSYVLAKVVFDSILYEGAKVKRYSPTGIDAMVALGNTTALPLLEKEMTDYPYASNMRASREFVGQYQPEFWQANLYNIWLDALRTLSAESPAGKQFPEAMRSEAWQRKQLQTQLASWSELRHNTVLYAKQSYTSNNKCEYATGFVEPYPETFARIKLFAEEAARRIEAADYRFDGGDLAELKQRQLSFFRQMASTLEKLETLARKELAAEPFTADEQQWVKKLIDIRGGGSGGPTYSGWYCDLFYGDNRRADWAPTIVDVHTDPNTESVLEVGVGSCNFLAAAIDNENDRMIYVGPVYSYYEFHQPAEKRLTDGGWGLMLINDEAPLRPSWTDAFLAPKMKREVGR